MDVVRLVREGNIMVAVVRGDSGNLHVVNVDLDVMEATCTCEAYEYRKECKHVVYCTQ
jgi:SWIM zinc finger.